jgi:tetratricopeptide (TPR) repeat protein
MHFLLILVASVASSYAYAEPEDLLQEEKLSDRLEAPASPSLQEAVMDLKTEIKDLSIAIQQMQNRLLKLERQQVESASASPLPPKESKEISKAEAEEDVSLKGWKKGPMPKEDQPAAKKKIDFSKEDFSKESFKEASYEEARSALGQGRVEEARTLFQEVVNKDKKHDIEALYWLGNIALLQDKNPKKASSLFSKAYQKIGKEEKKPLVLRQSILLKLAESLVALKETSSALVVLEQFFQLKSDKIPAEQKAQYKRLVQKAEVLKKRLEQE